VPADNLWALATTNAARMLRMADVGSLSEGHSADAVVFPVRSRDPLREILESNVLPVEVWIAGCEKVYRDTGFQPVRATSANKRDYRNP